MFKTLQNAWKIPELRKKLIFTMMILLIYRLGSVIPLPYVDTAILANYFDTTLSNTILGLFDAMSGSAFSRATVLALGIQPYINASIIIQLLTIAIPALERMAKDEGEEGKKKLERITRYTTVGLGLVLGFGYYTMLKNYVSQGYAIITDTGFLPGLVIVLAFTAGASFVMWLGEQITEHGIGNGISMILFAGIISRIPTLVSALVAMKWWEIILVLIGMAALVVFIVFINDAERRIPIQYAKRVVGRKVYGGQNTNMPIKVAMTGVMPIIFASALVSIPGTIGSFMQVDQAAHPFWYAFFRTFNYTSPLYVVIYLLLILAFNYFYVAIQYNPVEIANNLRRNNGSIPGFRPGKPTSDFLTRTLNKITLMGAIFLAAVAVLPIILGNLTGMSIQLGGTSLLIVVGVALDTTRSLDSFMTMRNHKGFLG